MSSPYTNGSLVSAIEYLADKSCLFNDISGSSNNCTHTAVKQQLQMVLSEVQELVNAFNSEQPVNVAAEGVDVVVTVVGLLQKLNNAGLDVSTVAKMIAEKNLEKFPTVSQVSLVNRTITDYASKGITVKPTINQGYYAIKDQDGKCRKPLGFEPVDLSSVNKGEVTDCFPVLH